MLIEDIHYQPSPKEIAYRLKQMAQSSQCTESLSRFIAGESYSPLSSRQLPRPVNGFGKVQPRNVPRHLKAPESVFMELNKYVTGQYDMELNELLPIEQCDGEDLIVLVPDNSPRLTMSEGLMKVLYRKNIEQTTKLIDKLLNSHNRMKVASLVSKIDVFGSSEERVTLAKDLTQILVAAYQICGDEDGEVVVKHYVKPLERSIRNLCEKINHTTTEWDKAMYVQAEEVIVIDTRIIDIETLREALSSY